MAQIEIGGTVIAAALVIEARALVAQQRAGQWPRSMVALSPVEALVRAWESYPRLDTAAREGFALARRALEAVAQTATHERLERDLLLRLLDEALLALPVSRPEPL